METKSRTTEEILVFRSKLIEEPEGYEAHIFGIELRNAKQHIAAHPEHMQDSFEFIEKLISQYFPKIPQDTLVKINLLPFNTTQPIKLTKSRKICPVFHDSKFELFERTMSSPLIFNSCEINDKFSNNSSAPDLFFKNCKIRYLKTQNTTALLIHGREIECLEIARAGKVESLRISDCKIETFIAEETVLNETSFDRVKFALAPTFIGAKFSNTVAFNNCEFLEFNKASLSFYREIKKIFQENHNELSAIEFASYELKSKFYILNEDPAKIKNPDWWVSLFYGHINDFGIRTYKPLLWISIVSLASLLIFDAMAFFNVLYEGQKYSDNNFAHSLSLAILVGLGPLGIFGKISEVYPNTLPGQLVHLFFNLITSLLWFFLIIGIRRKYKLS